MVSRFAGDEWWLDREGARDAYLGALNRAASAGGVEVLAYCLMSNHVHLVVVQGEQSLERFAKSLHTGFAGWAHEHARGRKAHGPVFADRPRTILIEPEPYLLELVRYVHNNPVRAGLVKFARSSRWSSHPAYIDRAAAPPWLNTSRVLERFGKDKRSAAERFDRFVDEGRDQTRRPELSGPADAAQAALVRRTLAEGHRLSNGILGSAAFVTRMQLQTERSKDVRSQTGRALPKPGKQGRASVRPTARQLIEAVLKHQGVAASELRERPRTRRSASAKRLAVWLWVHEYAGQQSAMARALQLDSSIISRYYGQALATADTLAKPAAAVAAVLRKATH